MRLFRNYFDVAIFASIVGTFVFIASQRLGTVPVPDNGDEAFTLQVPYEMLNRGQLSLPMYRYLGGNIENVWHSYTPAYFVMLSAFLKIFGVGLTQGRAFNLISAALALSMVYLIGRRLFDWRAALVAVVLLVSDLTFLERSRMLRNDFAAAAFALLAFYLYEIAARRDKPRFYVGAGLAAGTGVMCHTNAIYMLGAIAFLMLLKDGPRVIWSKKSVQFALGALAVMAYEIIYIIVDYKNFLLQNRGDKAHFSALSPEGLWENVLKEPLRYQKWHAGGETFPISSLSPRLTHLFQLLAIVAIVYLLVICGRAIKRGNPTSDPRVRVLLVTLFTVLFLAFITGPRRKLVPYMVHVTPWLALCVGIMVNDAWQLVAPTRRRLRPKAGLIYKAATASIALAAAAYIVLLVKQDMRFLRQVRNPDLASFAEFSVALKSIVPEELCPAAMTLPVIWLVFPESDRCFATIESRMGRPVDLNGGNYALIAASPKALQRIDELAGSRPLLGEMENTPYGDLRIYYMGNDPRYRLLAPKGYRFFGTRRGYVDKPIGESQTDSSSF